MSVDKVTKGVIEGWAMGPLMCACIGVAAALLVCVLLPPMGITGGAARWIICIVVFLIVAPGAQYVLCAPSDRRHHEKHS